MKHSIAYEVAEHEGVSVRTVQRMVRKLAPARPRGWLTSRTINKNAVLEAFQIGREECYNQPCRYARGGQLSLFE